MFANCMMKDVEITLWIILQYRWFDETFKKMLD